MGSILGMGVSPHLIEIFHWPSVFYIFGCVGVFWYFGWQKFASSSPRDDTAISKQEQEYILGNTTSQVILLLAKACV